jgi:hypothetical protein
MRKINIKNQAKAKSIEIAQISDTALEGIVSGVVAELNAEELARQSGDSDTLVSAQLYTDAAISALVNEAPTALDTLKELADALGDSDDAIAALVTTVDNNNNARIAGDQALSGQIDSVSGLVDAAIADLQADIQNQASSTADDLATLEDALDAETAARVSGDSNLEGLLEVETSARQAADTFLSGAITGVVSDLSSETSARQAADTFLSGAVTGVVADLATETSARQAADTFLSGAVTGLMADLTSEAGARAAADTFLSGAVTGLMADLDTEVAALEAADDELVADLGFVSGAVTGVVADLATETSARQAADTYLSGAVTGVMADLATETSARQAADAFVSGAVDDVVDDLADEVSDRQAAVSFVSGAIDALSADLALEVADRLVGDSELADDLDFVSGAVTGVMADLDTEEAARAAADTFLSGAITGVVANLATESSARVAGDSSTLTSAQTYTDNAISDLVNGAPVALDTLKELADALADEESALNALIITVNNNKTELEADLAFVSGAVDGLSADLDAEVSALAGDIGAEESARQAADTFISGAVTGVVADLAAETSARQAADTFLSGAITGVVADLDAEEAARAAADTALSGAIDALDADLGFVSGAVVTLDGNQTIAGGKTFSANTVFSQALTVVGNTALSQGLNVKVDGDAYSRLMVENGGTIYLGSGSAGWDTYIYRSGSQQLGIGGGLQVSKSVGITETLTVAGNTVLSGSATVAGSVNIGSGDYALWSAVGKVSAGLGFTFANSENNFLTLVNNGMLIGSAGSLTLRTNNGTSSVDAMILDASGNITTASNLEVAGEIRGGSMVVEHAAGSWGFYPDAEGSFRFFDYVSRPGLSQAVYTITTGQLMGLGTVAPTEKLDVAGKVKAYQVVLAGDPTLDLEAATKQYVDTADTATAADLATLTSAFNSFKATIGNPVDAETVTFDVNGEYVLAAAASGIVSGSKPILAINGVVQEYGTSAAADFQVVTHGGVMKKLKLNAGFVLEEGDTAVVWYRAAI